MDGASANEGRAQTLSGFGGKIAQKAWGGKSLTRSMSAAVKDGTPKTPAPPPPNQHGNAMTATQGSISNPVRPACQAPGAAVATGERQRKWHRHAEPCAPIAHNKGHQQPNKIRQHLEKRRGAAHVKYLPPQSSGAARARAAKSLLCRRIDVTDYSSSFSHV